MRRPNRRADRAEDLSICEGAAMVRRQADNLEFFLRVALNERLLHRGGKVAGGQRCSIAADELWCVVSLLCLTFP